VNVFLNTYAYLRHAEQMTSQESVLSFFEKIAALGYRLQHDQSDDYWYWEDLAASSAITSAHDVAPQFAPLFQAGIAPEVREGFSAFLQSVQNQHGAGHEIQSDYRVAACAVDLIGLFRGMNFSITFNVEKKVLLLTVDERLLDAIDTSERRDQWLEFARLLYQHFHPLFALPLNEDYGRFEKREEVEAGKIQWLRWFNFYGPEIVDHFGREHLLATPEARIEVFDDGGILLMPIQMKPVETYLKLRSSFVTSGN
jgi:hypothetical protein